MKNKRVLSVILSVVMILTMMPFGISASAAGGSMPFKDVKSGSWYYDSVKYAYDNGLMSGVGDERFDPDGNLTRAMFVTILGRMAGVETSSFPGSSFSDVQTGQWYSPYIQWAANNDITTGIGGGMFGVNNYVTREQMASLIARYLNAAGRILPDDPYPVSRFKDINKVDSWALEGLEVMRRSGIIKGDDNGYFNPLQSATRAQAAAIFERLFKALAPKTTSNNIDIGDIVSFGHYEQDNNTSNGKEPIEWIVIDKTGRYLRMISRYALDAYTFSNSGSVWAESEIRSWLNSTFMNTAFTAVEQNMMLTHSFSNPDSYWGYDENGTAIINNTGEGIKKLAYHTDGGEDCTPKVNLLTIDEARKYLGSEKKTLVNKNGEFYEGYPGLMAACTDYAKSKVGTITTTHITQEGEITVPWWLKSPGINSASAACVGNNGAIASKESKKVFTVRPTILIDKDKRPIEAGDIVKFGRYEQDNIPSNGKEDIEWIVLKRETGRALLVSRYVLDWKQYHGKYEDVTWENCSLRNWLNTTFFDSVFNLSEEDDVIETTISNPYTYGGYDSSGDFIVNNTGAGMTSVKYQNTGGNNTRDKVFLLSIDEANKYLGASGMKAACTDYAVANGATRYTTDKTSSGEYTCDWWLRSHGINEISASNVSYYGVARGAELDALKSGVRPAIWMRLPY